MNYAQQRRIKRERYAENKRKEDRDEMALHADEIMRAYETAYAEYNGRVIVLKYDRGFCRLDGDKTPRHNGQILFKGYRLKEIQSMTRELEARVLWKT